MNIAFEGVSFGYDPSSTVLDKINCCVKKGEQMTFVWRTGAGKSTVFRLLMGLYAPSEGQVLVCGIQADQIPSTLRRRLLGYVEQSVALVQGSVAEQISLFDPSINMAQIEAAARLVGLHEIILELPMGYDTPRDEICLSQGQLQLLSIARAVVAGPEILLLDEITANLDSETERRIMQALERASGGRTVLSISHRLIPHNRVGRIMYIE